MSAVPKKQAWRDHYAEGKGFRRVGEVERALLAEHTPVPDVGGRALDVGCGTGELAVTLAGMGYTVGALDHAKEALVRARSDHPGASTVRWWCLDVEQDPLPEPDGAEEPGFDLITLRLSIAFISSRTAFLRSLGARLRAGGAIVVITPLAETTPAERRSIALDEDELALLSEGFGEVSRFDAEGLAVLVLRAPDAEVSVLEHGRPTPQAVFGVSAVVTDREGRVLLGRSTRGVWELPAGGVETGESAQAAAVRELREETGLVAKTADAHLVTVLHDDRQDVRRIAAVVRVTAWEGDLALREADKFLRWEWFPLHTTAGHGKLFGPSAQALNAVWPGVIPGLPPVFSYPLAAERPPVPGEPDQAVRLRQEMARTVIDGGWTPSQPVRDALRAVPRHRFAPEVSLADAYDAGDRAVVTRRDETGRAISSVSAAWLQADMIESLRLEPGAIVFEAGSGGYNAELIAHVSGPDGRVVSADIDPWVVQRARAFLTEAGSGRVTAVEADAAVGAPARLVPRGGFDGSMITYNCWDISPAWREQLAEGGRLVMPLEMGGYTRAIAFERRGEVLHARRFTYCGFVRDQGQQARPAPVVPLLDGALTLRFDDGPAADARGLEEALRGRRHEAATGVIMRGANSYFGSLQLYAATTTTGFCRLAAHQESAAEATGITKDRDAPAIIGDASLAYLIHVRSKDGDHPADKEWEWIAYAFGEQGPALAERLVATVRSWDRHIRAEDNDEHADPVLTAHPAGTPDDALPAGDVLDKINCRLVFRWPGRDVALPGPVEPPVADAVVAEGA
ncbi:methyltransferase, FxLD system [Streptomyces californicus]|uniref:methyltransferase, FxLD system n=1 Tax=Streptomyces californicus TaxID=67351 RepID=UPI0036A5C3B7